MTSTKTLCFIAILILNLPFSAAAQERPLRKPTVDFTRTTSVGNIAMTITNYVQFSGGEHAWDLVTTDDQALATGLYLYTVEDLQTDEIQKGKFAVIK